MEIVIALSLSVIISSALAYLMYQIALGQKEAIATVRLRQAADLLQDRLLTGGEGGTRFNLRNASAGSGALFPTADEISLPGGAKVYRSILFSESDSSAVRRRLRFNATTSNVEFYEDWTDSGDYSIVFASGPSIMLREMYFFESQKTGGIPDDSTINVYFEMDDNGTNGRTDPADGSKLIQTVTKTFTVTLRDK
ncbi:hypothetical protein JXA32_04015 [Candidatus Sumerlaeota bacterium]|nr:hypothetical protein [Candidatus Sumerlaeota bacterium]